MANIFKFNPTGSSSCGYAVTRPTANQPIRMMPIHNGLMQCSGERQRRRTIRRPTSAEPDCLFCMPQTKHLRLFQFQQNDALSIGLFSFFLL